jgi:hypothetical protein
MNSEYKEYSLDHLENWLHDAISCTEATPKEIYDTIYKVVVENYEIYKRNADRCQELMILLDNKPDNQQQEAKKHSEHYYVYDRNDPNRENPFEKNKDKVKKWVLPVEADGFNNEYFVTFPDDLLEATNLKEGDQIEWIDPGDGSYILRKVEKKMTYDEAIAAGWELTFDGFWIKLS